MSQIEKLLGDYLNYLEIEKNRSPKTSENYKHYLGEFLKFSKAQSPADITENVVTEFRKALSRKKTVQGKELKKLTQSYYVIAIRNFLKYLAKHDIRVISAEKIELPKTPSRQIETIEYTDLERLLAAPRTNSLRDLRDKAILETFFSTGLRLAELCSLSRYIDLRRGELSVRGKGDKIRVVFLANSAKKAIEAYLAKRNDTEEKLFVSIDKSGKMTGPISPRSVQRLVATRAKQAGIPGRIHAHQLRHSFATDLLVNGADIRSVQALLGHANIATTQVYTHLTDKQLHKVHEAFHGRQRQTKK